MKNLSYGVVRIEKQIVKNTRHYLSVLRFDNVRYRILNKNKLRMGGLYLYQYVYPGQAF